MLPDYKELAHFLLGMFPEVVSVSQQCFEEFSNILIQEYKMQGNLHRIISICISFLRLSYAAHAINYAPLLVAHHPSWLATVTLYQVKFV
jgi:hypothetical protein